MEDMLIRNGTVVDGTGAPAFAADVRVCDGRIAEVGPNLEARGERVVDASGCYVTPGFIESHTHYDGTMWWQPDLDPLPGYGATTMILGNCGFSTAPLHRYMPAQKQMIGIFSFFEDIPEGPFLQKLPWDWNTWSEYRASVERNVKVPLNYAAYVGHIAIRLAAMGVEAWDREATPEEIARMCELLDDALAAGALGMSDNLHDHDGQDRPVPTLKANDAEFAALFDVMERYPNSCYQVIVDTFMRMTGPADLERLAGLLGGRKIRVQIAGAVPTLEFQKGILPAMQESLRKMREADVDVWPGFAHVSPTNVLSITKSLIFAQSNDFVWHEVVLADDHAEKARLLADPEWRARARESWDTKAWDHSPLKNPQELHLIDSENGAGPLNMTLKEYAESLGLHRSDAMADWILENGTRSTVHMAPFPKDEALTIELMRDPKTVGNISDAGAHLQMLCGGGENALLLTQYVRDEGSLSIEEAVHVMTGKLAGHFNLADRGVIAPGKRADVAVFNLDEIARQEMEKANDVPDGRGGTTWRFTRKPMPTRLTLVNGVPTFENGAYTGAKPGEFLSPAIAPSDGLAVAAE
ncbi:N-acyl-D-amino-acid deacylase family protein [Novosphingobium mathurense]|uniref:N-acyl-D-aspartate/D-glutamate deacylase n=1 Tax=Novosphingobium mathurense TaxID=428990 RepID=A0A1U6HXT0_9SPHN|nr:D-aminoacylase [Novosphingobium mathurense]SLK00608.1 N-acyl-D-aspartate/D-glutamate deacylase [Novosphingobium mathurense]